MKTLKLAVAVLALTCLNARAAIDANFTPLIEKGMTAAIGVATGYVAKKQLSLYTRNTAESKTIGKVGYFVPTAAITAAAVYAAFHLLTEKIDDKTPATASLAALAAITTFVASQNADEEDDVYQAYAAANEEKKK